MQGLDSDKDVKDPKKHMIGHITYSILDHPEYKNKFCYRNHGHKKGDYKKSDVDKWIEEKSDFTQKVFSLSI